jgi:hypothetical protein
MKPSIETERLVIGPWRDSDASDALVIYRLRHYDLAYHPEQATET